MRYIYLMGVKAGEEVVQYIRQLGVIFGLCFSLLVPVSECDAHSCALHS